MERKRFYLKPTVLKLIGQFYGLNGMGGLHAQGILPVMADALFPEQLTDGSMGNSIVKFHNFSSKAGSR